MPSYPENISDLLQYPPLPEEKIMLDRFAQVESLVNSDEALALYRLCMLLPPQKRILEIGSYRGGSTVAIGHAAKLNQHQIYCIDMWSEYQQQCDFSNMNKVDLNDMKILTDFIENTSFVKDRLYMLRGTAKTFSNILASNLFSLVFIDGAHDYYSVIDDIISALQVIEPGGILCGHDYHSAGLDVKRAVNDLIIKSETITSKGLIKNTSIWYGVIEDPAYELLISKVIRHMSKGNFTDAYASIKDGMETVKHTEEIERLKKVWKLNCQLLRDVSCLG